MSKLKMQTIATTVGLVVASLAVVGQGAPAYVLDLTSPTAVHSVPPIEIGRVSSLSGERRGDLPLALHIEALDRSSYIFGERVIYEVTIKNVGRVPVELPWSADRAAIELAGRTFLQSSLSLVVSERGREYLFGSVILDGSDDVPNSLQILLPDEVAKIKTEGILTVSDSAAKQMTAIGLAKLVRAVFTIARYPEGRWSGRLFSDNRVPVTVRFGRLP